MSINSDPEEKRAQLPHGTSLADIQEQVINANRLCLIGKLTSGVIHDINNANFILLNTQIISAAWDDALKILDRHYAENGDFMLAGLPYTEMKENMPKLSNGIVDASRRIRDIVDNLKAMVRHEMSSASADFDINEAVRTSVAIMNHQIKKSSDNFSVEYDDLIPNIKGSLQMIVQAFSNILLHAIQFSAKSRAAVSVATRYDAENGDAVVEVRCEGVVIDQYVPEHAVKPLPATNDNLSLGLDLFVVSTIVAEHGGSFVTDSAVSRGTTAQIRLPAIKQDAC